jgi:hypothetical protein
MSVAPGVKMPPKASAVLQMRKLKTMPSNDVSYVRNPVRRNTAMAVSMSAMMYEKFGVAFARFPQKLIHETIGSGWPSVALVMRFP